MENSGGEALAEEKIRLVGLPLFFMSHQPEWGAPSIVHTLPLTPEPTPSGTQAGWKPRPFHPLSSWASGSFLSLDTRIPDSTTSSRHLWPHQSKLGFGPSLSSVCLQFLLNMPLRSSPLALPMLGPSL